MPVDFRDSAERHWADAEYLFTDARIATADQLYGLAGECALKAVMQPLGTIVDPATGIPDKPYRIHIDKLWDQFVTFAQSRGGARYVSSLIGKSNPFGDWDIGRRYNRRGDFSPGDVHRHQLGAKETMLILQAAILDGVVT